MSRPPTSVFTYEPARARFTPTPCPPSRVQDPAPKVLVAESFRVTTREDPDGVLAHRPDLHYARFRAGAHTRGGLPFTPETWQAALATIAQTARQPIFGGADLFPRLAYEAHATNRPALILRLRPAAPPRARTRLLIPADPDPRAHPDLKGPDIARLAGFSSAATDSLGPTSATVDDVILHTGGIEPHLLEAATGTLFLHRIRPATDPVDPTGTHRIIFPTVPAGLTDQFRILASTTATALREQFPNEIADQPLPVDRLFGLLTETNDNRWSLFFGNAHRGISPVTEIIDARTARTAGAHPKIHRIDAADPASANQLNAAWWGGFTRL